MGLLEYSRLPYAPSRAAKRGAVRVVAQAIFSGSFDTAFAWQTAQWIEEKMQNTITDWQEVESLYSAQALLTSFEWACFDPQGGQWRVVLLCCPVKGGPFWWETQAGRQQWMPLSRKRRDLARWSPSRFSEDQAMMLTRSHDVCLENSFLLYFLSFSF